MAQSLYIAGTGPQSGKSVVLLGMMEFLSGHGKKVGFFRPVVKAGEEHDSAIYLIASLYNLKFPYDSMYGCTHDTARDMITTGRTSGLMSLILEKYKALEVQCDFVLSLGTDFTGVATALEFDFNAEVANNLGCPVLPVINGLGRTSQQLVIAVRALKESLEERGCKIMAVMINRVMPAQRDEISKEVKNVMKDVFPVYVLPEKPVLGKPTVAEIAHALNAKWISGEEHAQDREILHYKVAAMELHNFLDHVEEGSLVITPGDRSDIILGTLLSDVSETYPQIAGLLLTGNLRPAGQVQQLLEGLRASPVPVLSVEGDTFSTAMSVNTLAGAIVPENKRKIAAALGLMETYVDVPELERHIAVTRSTHVTPLMFEYELIHRAKSGKQHIVLPEGTDERILRASDILNLRGVVDLTLLGDADEIGQKISSLGLSLDKVNIINPVSSELRETFAHTYYDLRKHKGISNEMAYDAMADESYFGTMMVHHGNADGMVSGAVHTTQHTIRPAFEVIKTKPGFSIVSSVFLMCLSDHVLVYGDCAVNPDPTAQQLADIAVSSAETAEMFGIEPRVAMLSYSTGESGKGEDVEKVREAVGIAKKIRPDLKLDGPIQYDAAVDASVAKSKMPGSEVAGQATVFIFPDLNTGNNTYKAVQRSAGAVAIGPILQGLNKPVNDLSRGCTVPDIVNTVAITAIQAQAGVLH
jgi:phosphate acetyltransferase